MCVVALLFTSGDGRYLFDWLMASSYRAVHSLRLSHQLVVGTCAFPCALTTALLLESSVFTGDVPYAPLEKLLCVSTRALVQISPGLFTVSRITSHLRLQEDRERVSVLSITRHLPKLCV